MDSSRATAPATLFTDELRARVDRAREVAVAALWAERGPQGHWEGELSSSALSTATAVTALTLVGRGDAAAAAQAKEIVARGYAWLIANQNADGGWGDTTRSRSNISTTTLVWAAFGLAPAGLAGHEAAVAAAERWLTRAAGALAPEQLVRAIEQRYGRDRTFSIPILTMCALCGRLGPEPDAWRRVRQLPFEVAVLPQSWFGALQLPVVSYALPALIAIGQVRHGRRPTGNPLWRAVREACRARTLAKLAQLQPTNGGFLEATPLTSFVTMSLAGLGLAGHPIVRRGVAFITTSARPDGSWPIDTNLATWVTTLSLQALGPEGSGSASRGADGGAALRRDPGAAPVERRSGRGINPLLPDVPALDGIRAWLLRQQYRVVHPYTLAAPGGWAWTDLPGGVPDADDTPGALLALRAGDTGDPKVREAVAAGIGWLLDLQNRDGGMPTFCRGWGRLPFDRSSPDLTAHALRAWTAWLEVMPAPLQSRIAAGRKRAVEFLGRTQRADGAWIPLWFGHQEDSADENPLYGTARVVPALAEIGRVGVGAAGEALQRALHWLVRAQNPDGGWSGASGAASSPEETGVALEALAAVWEQDAGDFAGRDELRAALRRGAEWLVAAVECGRWREPTPIGFYFAKLWYFERLYPQIFTTGALVRLARLPSTQDPLPTELTTKHTNR